MISVISVISAIVASCSQSGTGNDSIETLRTYTYLPGVSDLPTICKITNEGEKPYFINCLLTGGEDDFVDTVAIRYGNAGEQNAYGDYVDLFKFKKNNELLTASNEGAEEGTGTYERSGNQIKLIFKTEGKGAEIVLPINPVFEWEMVGD
tara:strand:- start:769 stop:1218 length:450 start_codon:yes stop_codon:yes gene_type:complete